ncbi:MAG: DNA translocase FtsK 4TM domain-containing protein, partial [Moheibacter sp.]
MNDSKLTNNINSRKKILKTIAGVLLIAAGLFLLISFVSYLMNYTEDQSQLDDFWNREIVPENMMGKIGAYLGELIIY